MIQSIKTLYLRYKQRRIGFYRDWTYQIYLTDRLYLHIPVTGEKFVSNYQSDDHMIPLSPGKKIL